MSAHQLRVRESEGLPTKLRGFAPDSNDGRCRSVSAHPCTPTIGAEVDGVDLRKPLADDQIDELRTMLLKWKVLFFRNQHLTREQYLKFGEIWGVLWSNPMSKNGGHPFITEFKRDAQNIGQENVWHSDDLGMVAPSSISILRAIEVPRLGGDTLWADMEAAYDTLPKDLKSRLMGLQARNGNPVLYGNYHYSDQSGYTASELQQLREACPIVEHPVIRTHPETGRKLIYVNIVWTLDIVGLESEESDRLLELLYRRAAVPEYQCRFRWKRGDIAVWDNRAVQHYAVSDYWPANRRMERLTVTGDVPF